MMRMQQRKSRPCSIRAYQRWRKAHPASRSTAPLRVRSGRIDGLTKYDEVKRIGELRVENSRLRNLIAELLLEKITLEESLR